MAMLDTHKAVKTLIGAGFTEPQAEAMLMAMGESHDDLATKADIQALEQATKADIQALEQATKADIQALEQELKADIQTVRTEIHTLEQATKAEFAAVRAEMQMMEERLARQIAERLGKQTFQLIVAFSTLAGVMSGIVVAVLKLFP